MAISVNGQTIRIGNSDFRKLRTENRYYIDKSGLIDDILESENEVYFFTRPRRFGKSLNLSMLDAYFNMKYVDGPDCFKGLKISKIRPNDPNMNSNPVIHLSLNRLKNVEWEGFIEAISRTMSELYGEFKDIVTSDLLDEVEKNIYRNIRKGSINEIDLRNSLYDLSLLLHKVYGKQVIILIDEYDNAINEAESDQVRKRILDFFSAFLSFALKDNLHLRFAVVTGMMQIAKASIFSGPNNLYTDCIFDNQFEEYWGFSENEVRKLCADFGNPGKFAEMKEWYDGYRFGTRDAYNPWSVLSYVDKGFKPDIYWANVSSNSILEHMYKLTDIMNFKKILDLVSGGTLITQLDRTITYRDTVRSDKALFSVMAMSGYLKAIPAKDILGNDAFEISFPNKEVLMIMKKTVDDIGDRYRRVQ